MSSSGSDQPSAISLIDRAQGRSLTEIARQGVGGYLLAVSVAMITGLQTVFEFLILPFVLFADVAEESVTAFFIEPFGLIPIGVQESAAEIGQFDFLALPASVGIVLVSLLIVIGFIALSITSNFLPGVTVDNPIWDFFFGTPEEEVEGED